MSGLGLNGVMIPRHNKPRGYPRGNLPKLSNEQRQQLLSWMADPEMTYGKIAQRVKEEFGVKTSRAALSDFYSKHAAEPVSPHAFEATLILHIEIRPELVVGKPQ
jgi:hypothetical protein